MDLQPDFSALFVMWWVMMAAMMLPSAAPAILLYDRVRAQRSDDPRIAGSAVFLLGYLAVWALFSIAAASIELLLVTRTAALHRPSAQAAVMIAAGAYQLSPWKGACLNSCRSPVQFLSRNWRSGTTGAVRLGVLHGAYCVGCCWLLMLLLLVAGAMNFVWIASLALLVAAEKLLSRGEWIGRAAGVALIVAGVVLLI